MCLKEFCGTIFTLCIRIKVNCIYMIYIKDIFDIKHDFIHTFNI